jgi:DNA-binding LacI/PurR family transcriptional regulator
MTHSGHKDAVVTYRPEPVAAYLAAKDVLTHPTRPTAVVCLSDWAASALLQYADRNQDNVPNGFALAVFGEGNSILPREWPVTVFPAPVERLGAVAAESAFQLVQKESVDDAALAPDEPVVIQK